jgi:hypothetical protein
VILGEEWQTAEAMCCIHDLLNMYYLRMHPEKREKIRASARQTAEQWTWQEVVRRLLCELEHQAQAQGIGLPAWV